MPLISKLDAVDLSDHFEVCDALRRLGVTIPPVQHVASVHIPVLNDLHNGNDKEGQEYADTKRSRLVLFRWKVDAQPSSLTTLKYIDQIDRNRKTFVFQMHVLVKPK